MSENRNAQYRYQVLDRCFSDWNKKYTIENLLEIVNNHLYELEVRTLPLSCVSYEVT